MANTKGKPLGKGDQGAGRGGGDDEGVEKQPKFVRARIEEEF